MALSVDTAVPDAGVIDTAPAVDLAPPAPRGFINSEAYVRTTDNTFGMEGPWFGYGDGVSWDSTKPAIYRDGKYCINGTTPGTATHWGAGMEFSVNMHNGAKQAYAYKGKIVGFRIKLSGTAPQGLRVTFVPWSVYPEGTSSVSPFLPAAVGTDKVYLIEEAWVPGFWDSTNAGARVGDELFGVQIQVPGDLKAGAYDFCVDAFEPIVAVPSVPTCSVALTDGFESGTLANWTNSSLTTPKISSVTPLFGSYTAEAAVGAVQYVQKNFPATSQTRVSLLFSSTAVVANTLWDPIVYPVGVPNGSLPTLYVGADNKGTPVAAVCGQPLSAEQDCAVLPMPAASVRIDFNWRRGNGLMLGLASLAADGKTLWQTNAAAMTDETVTATGMQIGLMSNQITGSCGVRFDDVTIKTCTP